MEERRLKAYGFYASYEFVEKNYDEAARARIFSALSPAAKSFAALPKKEQWCDPAWQSEVWTGIVKEHPQDAQEQLLKVGRYMGAYATNTYLKLLMKMLTMKMFAKKFPDIWSRDANFGRVVVGDLGDIDSGRLAVTFEQMERFPYFGPICQGWLWYSAETMGLKNVRVDLLEWAISNPDPGKLKYHYNWTR